MKRSYLGTLAVLGSIGIMVGVSWFWYERGCADTKDECWDIGLKWQSQYRDKALAMWVVDNWYTAQYDSVVLYGRSTKFSWFNDSTTDSLRQCFEARPSITKSWRDDTTIYSPKELKIENLQVYGKPTLPDSLRRCGQKGVKCLYSHQGKHLRDSLVQWIADSLVVRDANGIDSIRGTDEQKWVYYTDGRKELREYRPDGIIITQGKDGRTYFTKPDRSYLYTDSGLNWSALPFLFTGDNSEIMLTVGNGNRLTAGKRLRVLEWVQRPTADTVEVYYESNPPCNAYATQPAGKSRKQLWVCYDIRYRWSARVEGM